MTAAAHSARRVHRGVHLPRLKAGVFALAGANSLATTWFFYHVPFYVRDKFQFSLAQNFELAALLGAVYAVFAFYGGRFAQGAGYFASFRLGAAIMVVTFLIGSQVQSSGLAVALLVVGTVGQCFTWPPLQGLMGEGETRARLRGLVGIYNFTWSVTSAFAYFTAGAMQSAWGLQSMFFVPAGLLFLEIIFSIWLEKQVNSQPLVVNQELGPAPAAKEEAHRSPVPPATFLKMAWLANPFAYLAINTIIPTIPSLAERLHLNETLAGIVCSTWLFSRAGAFVLLWLWPAWHYRFRFLAMAYAVMILCFAAMLLAPGLWMLMGAQIILGLALGLIYYSSLFYSMDVGETKGEHGGIHEAALGLGNCGGPAIAAGALLLFPTHAFSGTYAVCLLLVGGLGGLFRLRYGSSNR